MLGSVLICPCHARIHLQAAIPTAAAAASIIMVYVSERGEKVSEIQSLTARAQDLGRSINNWNTAYVFLVFVTVLLAALVFIAQFVVIRRSKELAVIQERLSQDKDLKIAEASRAAGEANQRAAEANEKAEKERLARVRLEEALAWRRLTSAQRTRLADSLQRFSVKRTWLIYNLNDAEAFGFASDLATAFGSAKWNPTEPEPIMKMTEGPVAVGTNPPLERGVVVSSTGGKSNDEAVEALVRQLLALGFDARKSASPAIHEQHPTSTVFVSVEPRPEGPQGEAKLRAGMKHSAR